MKTFQDFLVEITRPYVEKDFDPALIPLDDYVEVVDRGHKGEHIRHPIDAYETVIKDLEYIKRENYDILLNTITKNGIQFEVRTNKKKDGFIVLEKKKGIVVAIEDDEWGCVLIRTAKEYRGFGFGSLLLGLRYEETPLKQSGGFTNKGYDTFVKMWLDKVGEYFSTGTYSYLVKDGRISKALVDEIKKDYLLRKRDKKKEVKLNTHNEKNWLILQGGDYIILYDKVVYDYPVDKLEDDYWMEEVIKGVIGFNKDWSINRIYGDKNKMVEIALNFHDIIVKDIPSHLSCEKKGKYYSLKDKTIDIDKEKEKEKDINKRYDEYGEYKIRIMEYAEGLAE